MGFLDIFRKKNEVTKSVGASLKTTEKLLTKNQGEELYYQALKLLNNFPPNFDEARRKFQEAYNQGYTAAKNAAKFIGFNSVYFPVVKTQNDLLNYFALQQEAVNQYVKDKNSIGNLVYLITIDLKFNIFNTSSDPIGYARRFVDYEVYCIRKYGNESVMKVHNHSSLKNWRLKFTKDWDSGDVPRHSEYLNENTFPFIISQSNGKLNMFDGSMAVLRAAVVADIIDNYIR